MATPLWRTDDRPATLDRRAFLAGATALGVAVVAGRPADARQVTALTRRVGALEVVALLDATGPFTLTPDRFAAFPEADDRDWAAAERIDPDAFGPDGAWILDFRCFAVRRPDGRTILIDNGIGPVGSPASAWAPVPGRLPDALAEAGIAPADVDTVVLTHLHEDHFGWSVDAQGTPTFPLATYVLQQAEVADAAGGPVDDLVLSPLRRTGQLRTVDGRARLAAHGSDAVTVIPTPGHTVGHQSVLVDGRRDRVVVTGDVLVHAVQLADPDVGYVFESDEDLARATRRRLLAEARQGHGHHPALLATAHLTRPFVPAR